MNKDNTLILVRMDRGEEEPLYLFCRRVKDPWKGLYNFVGGKVEPNELPWVCAVRELKEETGIDVEGDGDFKIYLISRLTYYYKDNTILYEDNTNLNLWAYALEVSKDTHVVPEKNPLVWLPLSYYYSHEFEFAGEGNVGMLIKYYERIRAMQYEN